MGTVKLCVIHGGGENESPVHATLSPGFKNGEFFFL